MTPWRERSVKIALLVAASVGMGIFHNYVVSHEGIRLVQNPLQAVSGLEENWFIELEEAGEKWNKGATFIDARAEDFYTYEGHIKGAISLPYEDFESAFDRVRESLPPPEKDLVCYCSGYGCEESAEVAKMLNIKGYRRVFVYEGGWPEWSEAGYPVEMPSSSE
jgi:rhodanese-related sulfurtransferase